jgi:hypothetical protein
MKRHQLVGVLITPAFFCIPGVIKLLKMAILTTVVDFSVREGPLLYELLHTILGLADLCLCSSSALCMYFYCSKVTLACIRICGLVLW